MVKLCKGIWMVVNIFVHLICILIALIITLLQSILFFKGTKYIKGSKNIWLSLFTGSSWGVVILFLGLTFWINSEHSSISHRLGYIYYFVAFLIIILIDLIVLTRYKEK